MSSWFHLSSLKQSIQLILSLIFIFAALIDMPHASEHKLVIAHRGASAYLPEHTLAAKAMAHAMGADFIEQDVVLTSDGVPIVLHDIHLDTVTDVAERFPDRKRKDGRFYAIDFTLAEIRTLKVHERTRLDSGAAVYPNRFPLAKSVFQVATFAEEIELIQGLNRSTGRDVGIFPEIKAPQFHRQNGQDLSKTVLEILTRYGYASKKDRMILQCFDWAETRRIRNELGYKGRLAQLLGENNWGLAPGTDFEYLKSPRGLNEIAEVADSVAPWINHVVSGTGTDGSPQITDLVSQARATGLKVYPYTARADALPPWANSYQSLLETLLLEAGVDGIFTDFTDLTVRFLDSSK